MPEQPENRKCPSCGGKNLVDGSLSVGQTFVLKGHTIFTGYVFRTFVCLHCGLLGHYVEQKDLEDIRRKA
jgi:rubredoxin